MKPLHYVRHKTPPAVLHFLYLRRARGVIAWPPKGFTDAESARQGDVPRSMVHSRKKGWKGQGPLRELETGLLQLTWQNSGKAKLHRLKPNSHKHTTLCIFGDAR